MSKQSLESYIRRITGRIRERESGLGVKGLIVRAYDKDLLYDDLLGNAVTDVSGSFEIHYSRSDYQECLEGEPDIYVVIFAPPNRSLMDTKEDVRRDANVEEHFELQISRRLLGELSPQVPDDRVIGKVSVSRNQLRWERRGEYELPRLPGFATGGPPGAPALPEQIQFVALPLGTEITDLEVILGESVCISAGNPFPAQAPFFDDEYEPVEFVDFTLPDPAFYEGGEAFPHKLAEVIKVEEVGLFQIAAVQIRPMQYDPANRSYLFYPNLTYQLLFDSDKARAYAKEHNLAAGKIDYHHAELLNDILSNDLVKVAPGITMPGELFFAHSPHLIITDNYNWPEAVDRGDGTLRPPTIAERGPALAGNLAKEFWRLASWKTSRGVYSHVVTISDIVGGKYGDFTEGGFARDLQEVVRNFLKFAHQKWNTLYVLMGGDVEVVPMRRLAGTAIIPVGAQNDPPKVGKAYYKTGNTYAKLYFKRAFGKDDIITTHQAGTLIPYDREAGAGKLGWYYTTEADFSSKSSGFTRLTNPTLYVIVEGPAAVLNDDYCYITDINSIPSDFYYASLVGPPYGKPGVHDFDGNNNGIYGQYRVADINHAAEKGKPIENFDEWCDVYVGRAPVKSGAEAKAFVGKVITYEKLVTSDGHPVDPMYLKKVILAAGYWAESVSATVGKERVRKTIEESFPRLDQIERHYEKLDVEQQPPPPLIPLNASTIRASLDEGAHFVSLSGHGDQNGCCGVKINSRPDFKNNNKYFIMYADSCTTAKPDGSSDSLAEKSIRDPNGGAVAYVGYTRGGYWPIGNDYENFFWCALQAFGRLGQAANMRLTLSSTQSWWTVFVQNLFGDPEMRVWTDAFIVGVAVTKPETVVWGGDFTIRVHDEEGLPLANQKVTILARGEESEEPVYLETRLTNVDGRASFRLPKPENAPDRLEITVAQRGYRTHLSSIPVKRDLGK